jgi:hypothetical protein
MHPLAIKAKGETETRGRRKEGQRKEKKKTEREGNVRGKNRDDLRRTEEN